MIGTLLQPEIEELIRAQEWDALRDALTGLDPSDIAELIVDLEEARADVAIFRILPRDSAAKVFSYLPPDHQEGLLRGLSNEQMRSVLAGIPPDDQVRLIEHLPAEVTRRMLEVLSPDELSQARDLLGYPPDTAGRFMTPQYVALFPEMTAE